MKKILGVTMLLVISVYGIMAILGVGGVSFAANSPYSPSYSCRSATSYPLLSTGSKGVEGHACVSYSGYVYCVVGTGNDSTPAPNFHYAKLTSQHNNLNWKSTNS